MASIVRIGFLSLLLLAGAYCNTSQVLIQLLEAGAWFRGSKWTRRANPLTTSLVTILPG